MESHHALNRRTSAHSVVGFLLKRDDGYGCVQPWTMFGHPSVEEHWQALERGESLPLLEQALACAEADASARKAGLSWWDHHLVPLSHATITDLHQNLPDHASCNFTHAKLKASWLDIDDVIDWSHRHPGIRLRLDFNEVPDRESFTNGWKSLPVDFVERMDWIEDPFSYDKESWLTWQKQYGVAFAVDRAFSSAAMTRETLAIWKPAWQSLPSGSTLENVVVTSAMDHPVGQAWAAFSASRAGVSNICGLRTDHLFQRDAFTECMGPWLPSWPSIPGTGMGFDDLLEKLPWTRIR